MAAPTLLTDQLTSSQAQARHQLLAVRRQLLLRHGAALLLPLLAAGGLLGGLAQRWPGVPAWGLGLAGLVALGLAAWRVTAWRRLTLAAVARQLDRRYPALQDSTGLLLQAPDTLPLLGRLQAARVAQQLNQLSDQGPALLPVSFTASALLTGGLLVAALGLGLLPERPAASAAAPVAVRFGPAATRPPARVSKPARIEQVRLLVTPPAYTRRAAFGPAGASFACPAGSRVRWLVQVSAPGPATPVLELGPQRLLLRAEISRPATYSTEQTLTSSLLYRLRYAGQVSDDYAIEVQPDQPPTVRLMAPAAYTRLPARGARPEVPLQATLRDDYGLTRAELVLTVASGEGEAVKFRELRRDLGALAGQPTQATVRQTLRLSQLGMHPGDELYVYVQAQDSHGQRTRSDAHLVQWQDSAAAAAALSLGLGVNTAPAYFRSQRQLIIDTEKLLTERRRLSAAEFASRSNALGIDQQALRLRYGKFLGEEAEKGLGPTAGPPVADEPALPIAPDAGLPIAEEPAAPTPAGPGNDHDDHDHASGRPHDDSPTAATDALLEAYTHKHDDAETADFLEPAVKAKLHAVLDEMWAAELRLRTGQPAAARPYEYRALRLLKEVQQQTRAYVRKAGLTPAPQPEAALRLTGELRGAAASHATATVPAPAAQPTVRAALRQLAAARAGQPLAPAAARMLDQATAVLANEALQRPGFYLPALRALRTLAAAARAGRPASPAALTTAEQGLSDLLPAPTPAPSSPPAPDRLARRYWQELGD